MVSMIVALRCCIRLVAVAGARAIERPGNQVCRMAKRVVADVSARINDPDGIIANQPIGQLAVAGGCPAVSTIQRP